MFQLSVQIHICENGCGGGLPVSEAGAERPDSNFPQVALSLIVRAQFSYVCTIACFVFLDGRLPCALSLSHSTIKNRALPVASHTNTHTQKTSCIKIQIHTR